MTRELAVLALSLASLALAGCGYVGEPLPPALNIPVSITDLSALQRGGQVYVRFTIPGLTTEQLPVTGVEEVELRAGANKVEPFDTNAWASGARRIDVTKLTPGEVIVTAAAREWVGSEVIVGARMRNRKGRWSGWSNLATLNVVEPAVTPAGVTAGSIPTGAKLSWQGPVGLKFRVFRDATLLGEVAANEYADATAEFGKEYVYQVIAMRGAAESEPTAPIRFTPADVFAPATPGGLTLIAGTRSAELEIGRAHV